MASKGPWSRVGMGPRPRSRPRPRMGLRTLLALALAVLVFLKLVLPYDNALRLAVRWNFKRLEAALTRRPSEGWVYADPEFPVDVGRDVAVILKTGYGTRERVPAWVDSLSSGNEFEDILIIADAELKPIEYRGQQLRVHNAVEDSLRHLKAHKSHPRVAKYFQLAEAIRKHDEALALQHCRSFGWELDAMKFISGLELAYKNYPDKKWYLLVDDDTFIVQPSLKPLLEHLNPRQPQYLGNAVGDFKARFAHGGSAIILSQAAMEALFSRPKVLSSFYVNSLEETWGDRLLAKALLKLGIYLDETYCHLFNGEPPLLSKIRADRLCSPVISFHKLPSPAAMREVGERFRNVSRPVIWNDLWDMYGYMPPWRQPGARFRRDWDHVGTTDESTLTIRGVKSAEACKKQCNRRFKACLAWAWDSETGDCHVSHWMIVGKQAAGYVSGVNIPRAKRLETNCILY
ncbi:hypothetical protein VTI74DRAFT_5607 [Chaetomium olivicolor]